MPPMSMMGILGGSLSPDPPPTTIKSVPFRQYVRGDLGITLNVNVVSAWADQTSNAHHFVQASGPGQPLYTAADATLGNRATVLADGINDTLLNSTMPNGDGLWISAIIKTVAWVTNRAVWGSNAAPEAGDLISVTGTPKLGMFNGTSTQNVNLGLPVGTWGRVEMFFSGVASYLKLRSTLISGGNPGIATSVGCALFSTIGVAFGNYALAERTVCLGKPTAAEIADVDAYYTAWYKPGLV